MSSSSVSYKNSHKANTYNANNITLETSPVAGREYGGQITMTIDGKDYILIGDKQQLVALDSVSRDSSSNGLTSKSINITGPIWKVRYARTYAYANSANPMTLISAEMVYPGDADLTKDIPVKTYTYATLDRNSDNQIAGINTLTEPEISTSIKDFSSYAMYADLGYIDGQDENLLPATVTGNSWTSALTTSPTTEFKLGSNYAEEYHSQPLLYSTDVGVTFVGGTLDEPDVSINSYSGSVTYSPTNNYIIFRGIDMKNEDDSSYAWKPLMFSGTMIGIKVPSGGKIKELLPGLLNDGNYSESVGRPSISNVTVSQSEDIDTSMQMGVGFFATVTDVISTSSIGVSGPLVRVENIELKNLNVSNTSVKAKSNQTLVSGLLGGVGWLVGGLVSGLVKVITIGGVDLNLDETLSALLSAREKDPTAFATGGFVGRLVGHSQLVNCAVTNANVSNVMDYTGGMIGYSEGATQYEGLSATLGGLTDFLSSLLNVIPGLGLGDLITILLGNVLSVDKLIPTGYINPVVKDCSVNNLSGNIGSQGKSFAGGFVGRQSATRMFNCDISDSNYTVSVLQYGGGFAGVARDADIQGALTDLGVELVRVSQPQSLLVDCVISDSTVTVNGTDYLGGFAGVMANSYAVNSDITGGAVRVNASGSYAGGFTGLSTMGWITSVGKDEAKSDSSLLKTVNELLTGLLGSTDSDKKAKGEALLTLVGLTPSVLLGCNIQSNSVTVNADGDYAGGFVGKGDAILIGASNDANLQEIPYWKYRSSESSYYDVTEAQTSVKGLSAVSSGSYAGGIIGFAGTANTVGLLNGTLGVADFKSFKLENVSAEGVPSGFTVTATDNFAGGAVGLSIGGIIEETNVGKLRSVTANNYAAGFISCAYPGDIASSSGLQLSLLGLNILDLKNLLSVGAAIEVEIRNSDVYGLESVGCSVSTIGTRANETDPTEFLSGGYIAYANSTSISNSHAYNIREVTSADNGGYAGGFVGASRSGGLADAIGTETGSLGGFLSDGILNVNGLLSAVAYMIPDYNNCTVHFVNSGVVSSDVSGGFVADMQSGTVDNSERGANDYYSVYNINKVLGKTYAGGFGGVVQSGALAKSDGGLSILGGSGISIGVDDLISLAQAYVPFVKYAGVKTDGFIVKAIGSGRGIAGGFAGFLSGAQVSYSDVNRLAKTSVSPPDKLEGTEGSNYFDTEKSSYSVTGETHSGGYVGHLDIGSAASVGGGLKALGSSISLANVLDVLSVVVSAVEHSNVYGAPGGFSVLSSYGYPETPVGTAGGFAGRVSGGHIQDSNSYNFSYVIGQTAAGGYVGILEPGDVANILESTEILGGLVSASNSLASIAEDFVPTIRNSETTCIPCGGAVRADASSDVHVMRGMAGGYCGHNEGGNIRGNNAKYGGPIRPCSAVRILSVYGAEYAGGFTGLMDCADTASTGNLSLLFGLVSVDNLLGALSIVYPTEENTAVYGPLAKLDYNTWNVWVDYVGKRGGYGAELASSGKVSSQEELDNKLADYIYGTHVAAGDCAGGYVGAMLSGVVTNGNAYDTKQVTAARAAGGYAGNMRSGGAANLGSVSILGLNLNLGQTVDALQVFVPTVKVSSTTGYRNGLTVYASGAKEDNCGYAGGYVGLALGAQIWGDEATNDENEFVGCKVSNLRRVGGKNAIGGYAGRISAGAVAEADTGSTSDGLLQGVLDGLISTPESLATALQATVSTIRCASVDADSDWGFVVDGQYQLGAYASYAGGFVGRIEASVVGELNKPEKTQHVNRLRGVDGGYYAGGFFGLADVGSVADVGGSDGAGSSTTILNLIKAGNVSVLDAFRPYIYNSSVSGVSDGLAVYANLDSYTGTMHSYQLSGSSGGFGGGLMNGSVHNSKVSGLGYVEAPNYAAGFVGYMGKNGGVELDQAEVQNNGILGDLLTGLGLDLNSTVQALSIVGSVVKNCDVEGYAQGFDVKTNKSQTTIDEVVRDEDLTGSTAAGFAGYADISSIDNCTVKNLNKVESPQLAAGFVGRTSIAYLVDAQVNSKLVNLVLNIVNELVKALYLKEAQQLNAVKINLGIIQLNLMAEGDLLYVNLLGLKISVGLSKNDSEYDGQTDAAIITIGDSTVKLPCNEDGLIPDENGEYPNLELTLIKGNRTNVTNSSVSGVKSGYDVFGGGASSETDGFGKFGYAGGFVAYNDEGALENNRMWLCDVVRGTYDEVGPFAGHTSLQSVYGFNTVESIEGDGNYFSVYRTQSDLLSNLITSGETIFSNDAQVDEMTGYNRYDVLHYKVVKSYTGYEGAKECGAAMTASKEMEEPGAYSRELRLYESPSKAVLMMDAPNPSYEVGLTPEPDEGQNPCSEYVNYTIQKIWKDWNNLDGIRPESITVLVYAENDDNVSFTVTLNEAENASKWSSTWKKVVTLPAGKMDSGGDEIEYYYTYRVEENAVDGYSTKYDYDDTEYIAQITNSHSSSLPITGVSRGFDILLLGAGLFCLGCESLRRSKGKEQEVDT